MKNKILLSKQGFYDDCCLIDALTSTMLGGTFAVTYLYCMKILSDKLNEKEVILTYPERFFPNNMSAHFWGKVKKLVVEGFVFDIKTSDVIALAWIPPTHNEVIGIDERFIQNGEGEIHTMQDYFGSGGYGSRISDLMYNLRF